MLYDVYTYDTQEDFDNRKTSNIYSGYISMKDAKEVGFDLLEDDKFEVIKVQSYDREEIEIIARHVKP